VTLLQLAFTYAPVMAALFDTRPVGIGEGLLVLAVGPALLLILELEKRVVRALAARRRPHPDRNGRRTPA